MRPNDLRVVTNVRELGPGRGASFSLQRDFSPASAARAFSVKEVAQEPFNRCKRIDAQRLVESWRAYMARGNARPRGPMRIAAMPAACRAFYQPGYGAE